MNDDQKTKEQLLEELEHERERADKEHERSLALQEVSKKVAGAHDNDAVLDLIVNEAARLLDTSAPISPPPPIETITASNSSTCSLISRPTVPVPVAISGPSNG